MNSIVFAERKDSCIQYYNFDGKFITDNPMIKAVLVSRLDFDVKFIKLPSLGENDIEHFLRYKIRSLYPGNPEETIFDYDIIKRGKNKHAVLYITLKTTISEYRKKVNSRALLLPFNIVRNIALENNKNKIIIFWQLFWFEIIIVNNGIPHFSIVLNRENGSSQRKYKLNELLLKEFNDFNLICFCGKSDKESLKSWIMDNLKVTRQPLFFHLENLKWNKVINPDGIFRFKKRKKRKLLSKIIIYILAGVAFALALLILNKFKNFEDENYRDLNRYYSKIKENIAEVKALENDINNMEKQLDVLNNKQPVDSYQVLTNIALVLGNSAKIKSFILEGSFFRIEATGRKPMEMMGVFNKSSAFKNVRLIKVIPINNSENLFVITGNINVK